MKQNILIIEDDDALRGALAQTMDLAGFTPLPTASFLQARRTIRSNFQGVILSDIQMPDATGMDVLAFAQSLDADLPVVLMTGHSDVATAMAALKGGAYDYLEKPCAPDRLVEVLTRALDHRALVLRSRKMEVAALRNDAAAVNFPGAAPATVQLHKHLRQASENTRQTIHLYGDKGAGKKTASYVINAMADPSRLYFRLTGLGATANDVAALPWTDQPADVLVKAASQMTNPTISALQSHLNKYPETRLITSDRNGVEDLTFNINAVPIRIPSLADRRPDLPAIFEASLRIAARNLDIDMPDIRDAWRAELLARQWDDNMVALRQFAATCALAVQANAVPDHDQTLVGQMENFER
ncbi:MAG: response regulator, partial [Planktomarina sp.]